MRISKTVFVALSIASGLSGCKKETEKTDKGADKNGQSRQNQVKEPLVNEAEALKLAAALDKLKALEEKVDGGAKELEGFRGLIKPTEEKCNGAVKDLEQLQAVLKDRAGQMDKLVEQMADMIKYKNVVEGREAKRLALLKDALKNSPKGIAKRKMREALKEDLEKLGDDALEGAKKLFEDAEADRDEAELLGAVVDLFANAERAAAAKNAQDLEDVALEAMRKMFEEAETAAENAALSAEAHIGMQKMFNEAEGRAQARLANQAAYDRLMRERRAKANRKGLLEKKGRKAKLHLGALFGDD